MKAIRCRGWRAVSGHEYQGTTRRVWRAEIRALLGDTRTLLLVVLGAVVLVLLIACGMWRTCCWRGAASGRGDGDASALGAKPGQDVRQLLVESVTLGVMGGLAGCGLAVLTRRRCCGFDRRERAARSGCGVIFCQPARVCGCWCRWFQECCLAFFGTGGGVARADCCGTEEGGRAETAGGHRLDRPVIVGQVALALC